jgi:hypothetical protein
MQASNFAPAKTVNQAGSLKTAGIIAYLEAWGMAHKLL